MNFSQGHSGTKVQCESCLFPKEKHQNLQKWAKFMNFSFWPFLWFWFARATPHSSHCLFRLPIHRSVCPCHPSVLLSFRPSVCLFWSPSLCACLDAPSLSVCLFVVSVYVYGYVNVLCLSVSQSPNFCRSACRLTVRLCLSGTLSLCIYPFSSLSFHIYINIYINIYIYIHICMLYLQVQRGNFGGSQG